MRYRKGFVFQLAEDELFHMPKILTPDHDITRPFIELTCGGTLRVKAGYAWDGASGPIKMIARILELTWKWLWKKYVKKFLRGACFHDAACQLLRQGVIPPAWLPDINEYMYQVLITDGMSKWRARGWIKTLNKFDFYADPKNAKEIFEAP